MSNLNVAARAWLLMLLLSSFSFAQQKLQIGASTHCEPEWTEPNDLKFEGNTAMLLTHFTDRLDTEHLTKPGLHKLVDFAKSSEMPFVYLHEADAAAEQYFYNDCNPTAYVNSSLGEFSFNTGGLDHVILAGGYFELCFNNTFSETIANWSALRGEQERKITLVTDAIYGVASDSLTHDTFNADLRAWIREQPSATLRLSSVLDQLKPDDAWIFLSRRWDPIPPEFGLHVRYKDVFTAIRFAQEGFPTIVLHYTTTDELEKVNAEQAKRPSLPKR